MQYLQIAHIYLGGIEMNIDVNYTNCKYAIKLAEIACDSTNEKEHFLQIVTREIYSLLNEWSANLVHVFDNVLNQSDNVTLPDLDEAIDFGRILDATSLCDFTEKMDTDFYFCFNEWLSQIFAIWESSQDGYYICKKFSKLFCY